MHPPYWGPPILGYGAQNFRPAGQNRVFGTFYIKCKMVSSQKIARREAENFGFLVHFVRPAMHFHTAKSYKTIFKNLKIFSRATM